MVNTFPQNYLTQTKPNQFGENNIMTETESYGINQLFDNPQEAKTMNITELVRGLSEDEIKQGLDEAKSMKNEKNILIKYEEYVSAYKRLYNDDNYEKNMTNKDNKVIAAKGWSNKTTAILKKIAQIEEKEKKTKVR